MSTLAFAETVGQAKAALIADSACILVAVTPVVDDWAEREGHTYWRADALMPENCFAELAQTTIDLVEAAADRVDTLKRGILLANPHDADISLRGYFHYLKANLDGYFIRLEQIAAALTILKPARLIAFRLPDEPVQTGITSFDKPVWGATSRLAPRVAEARHIPVDWLDHPGDNPLAPAPAAPTEPETLSLSPAAIHPSAAKPALWVRILHRLFPARQSGAATRTANNAPLLLHAQFKDLGDAIIENWVARGGEIATMQEFLDRYADPDSIQPADQETCRLLWQAILNDPEIHAMLTRYGVPLFSCIEGQWRTIVVDLFPALLSLQRRARQALSRRDRNVVFLAGGMVDSNYIWGRAAHRAGAPFVSHHYGGFLGYALLPMHERYDMADCDYFLCGGLESAETFRQPSPLTRWRASTRRARPVAVGMPWVEEIMQTSRKHAAVAQRGQRRLMVILNAMVGDCRYMGYVFPSELAYWRFCKTLIERLAIIPDMEIIVKPPLHSRYPQLRSPVEDWIRTLTAPNISILPEIPLRDCLDRADAFVTESPSTPLLHLIATDKPVLAYIDREVYRLQPGARDALRRRCAVFAETEADFLAETTAFAKQPRWSTTPVDDDFLYKYVIGRGQAAQRAVDFLFAAARRHPLSDAALDRISHGHTGQEAA
ncbi:MAG: hypothetical protein ACK4FJ_09980 [Ferrovibrio sp.]|uniref:hypothetical protein n=1 Tax=Ferrovibrio sp. TaxID=1917215 RepID=UPI00391C30E1